MLQQTQVSRVLPKYRAFIRAFPTVRSLAQASLCDVLVLWQGLGYNRRAKALHAAATEIVATYGGVVPDTESALVSLPGVGRYTARAVLAFAFNKPVALLETNVRTVFLHELMRYRDGVPDAELLKLAARLAYQKRSREWYWALMDYGAHLKMCGVRVNERSKHYRRQTPFHDSDRQVRGALVRALTTHFALTEPALARATSMSRARVHAQLSALVHEGLVRKKGRRYEL